MNVNLQKVKVVETELVELGKALHRDDGCFEFVGKIPNEIAAKNFRIAQFLRHGIEAFHQFLHLAV